MKYKKLLLSSLVVPFMFFCFFININKIFAETNHNLKVSYTIGFQGKYKVGTVVPFNVEINNQGDDFEGIISVSIPKNDKSHYTEYYKNINISKGSNKTFKLDIPVNDLNTTIYLKVKKNNNLFYEKKITLSGALSENIIGVGILSDNFNSLSYLNNFGLPSITKLVNINENSIDSDYESLKFFNVIIINDFDTSKLTDEKYTSLKNWIQDGGILLLGTGNSYGKSLSVFKDNFLPGNINGVKNIETNKLSLYTNESDNSPINLDVVNFNTSETPYLEDNGNPLIYNIDSGYGKLIFCTFDLGSNSLNNWGNKTDFGKKLLTETCGDLLPSYDANNPYIAKMGYANMPNEAFNLIPNIALKTNDIITLLFIVYILMVGFGIYFVLKKKEQREKVWTLIPVISVIFFAIIFLASNLIVKKSNKSNIFNTITLGETNYANVKTMGSLFLSKKGKATIQSDDGKSIYLNNNSMANYYYQNPQDDKDNINTLSILDEKINVDEKNKIESYDNSIMSPIYFSIKNVNSNLTGSIDGYVKYMGNKYQIHLTNNTGFDIHDCYLLTINGAIYKDVLKNGETLQEEKSITEFDVKGYKTYFDKLYGNPNEKVYGSAQNNYQMTDINKLPEEDKNKLFNDYKMNSYLSQELGNMDFKTYGLIFTGWSNDNIVGNIKVNNINSDIYENNLIVKKIKLDYKSNGIINIPFGMISPKVTSESSNVQYDEYSNVINGGTGNINIEYKIDGNINIKNASIVVDVNSLADYSKQGVPSKSFSEADYIKIKIFNYEKNDYDVFTSETQNITESNLNSYVKDNLVKLRVEFLKDGVMSVPDITVEGSEK